MLPCGCLRRVSGITVGRENVPNYSYKWHQQWLRRLDYRCAVRWVLLEGSLLATVFYERLPRFGVVGTADALN